MSLAGLESSWSPAISAGAVTAKSLSVENLTVNTVPLTALSLYGAPLNQLSATVPVVDVGTGGGETVGLSQTLFTRDFASGLVRFSDVVLVNPATGFWTYTYPVVFTAAPTIVLSPIRGDVGPILGVNGVNGCSGYLRFAENIQNDTTGIAFAISGVGYSPSITPASFTLAEVNSPFGGFSSPFSSASSYFAMMTLLSGGGAFTTTADLNPALVAEIEVGWNGGFLALDNGYNLVPSSDGLSPEIKNQPCSVEVLLCASATAGSGEGVKILTWNNIPGSAYNGPPGPDYLPSEYKPKQTAQVLLRPSTTYYLQMLVKYAIPFSTARAAQFSLYAPTVKYQSTAPPPPAAPAPTSVLLRGTRVLRSA